MLARTSREVRDICFGKIYLLNLHDRYLDMIRSGGISQIDLEFMFTFQHREKNMAWQWTKFLNQCLREITDPGLFNRCISLRDIDLTYHIAPEVVISCSYPLASHLINTYPGVYIIFDVVNGLLVTKSPACVDIYNIFVGVNKYRDQCSDRDYHIEMMFKMLGFMYWMSNWDRIRDVRQWCIDCIAYGDDNTRFIACSIILRDGLDIKFTPRTLLELEICHHLSNQGFNSPLLFRNQVHMNKTIRAMRRGSFPEDVSFCYSTNSYSREDYYLIEHRIMPYLDIPEVEFYLRRNYCDDINGTWRSLRCITRALPEYTLDNINMPHGCRECLKLISVIDSKLGRIYHCNEM